MNVIKYSVIVLLFSFSGAAGVFDSEVFTLRKMLLLRAEEADRRIREDPQGECCLETGMIKKCELVDLQFIPTLKVLGCAILVTTYDDYAGYQTLTNINKHIKEELKVEFVAVLKDELSTTHSNILAHIETTSSNSEKLKAHVKKLSKHERLQSFAINLWIYDWDLSIDNELFQRYWLRALLGLRKLEEDVGIAIVNTRTLLTPEKSHVRIYAISQMSPLLTASSKSKLTVDEQKASCCPKAWETYNCKVSQVQLVHTEQIVGCNFEVSIPEEPRTQIRHALQQQLEKEYNFVAVFKAEERSETSELIELQLIIQGHEEYAKAQTYFKSQMRSIKSKVFGSNLLQLWIEPDKLWHKSDWYQAMELLHELKASKSIDPIAVWKMVLPKKTYSTYQLHLLRSPNVPILRSIASGTLQDNIKSHCCPKADGIFCQVLHYAVADQVLGEIPGQSDLGCLVEITQRIAAKSPEQLREKVTEMLPNTYVLVSPKTEGDQQTENTFELLWTYKPSTCKSSLRSELLEVPEFEYFEPVTTEVLQDGTTYNTTLVSGEKNVMIGDYWFQAMFICMEIEDSKKGMIANFHSISVPRAESLTRVDGRLVTRVAVQVMTKLGVAHQDLCADRGRYPWKSCYQFKNLPKNIDSDFKVYHLVLEQGPFNDRLLMELTIQKEIAKQVNRANQCVTTVKIHPREETYESVLYSTDTKTVRMSVCGAKKTFFSGAGDESEEGVCGWISKLLEQPELLCEERLDAGFVQRIYTCYTISVMVDPIQLALTLPLYVAEKLNKGKYTCHFNVRYFEVNKKTGRPE